MPKTKISEWSSTPANNTDIDSINIAEGCAPSGINDAIRELMSQVKDLYAGTSGDLIAVAGGGTGAGTLTGIVKGNGTSAFTAVTAPTGAIVGTTDTQTLTNKTLTAPTIASANITTALTLTGAAGTSGQVLTSGGSGAAPTWTTASGGSSQWTTTGSDIYYTTGSVGIGTASPTARLQLGDGSSGQLKFRIHRGAGTDYTEYFSDTGSTVIDTVGGGNLLFRFSGTEKARFNTLGSLILAGGTTSANGTGITFPATQSASSDANTLDDYEEGTFTPTIIGGTTAGTGTYDSQVGFYTKIGNMVFFYCRCSWSAHTGTGSMSFSGLPFTISSDTVGSTSVYMETAVTLTAGNVLQMRLTPSSTNVLFAQYATGGSNASAVAFDTSADVRISGQYKI